MLRLEELTDWTPAQWDTAIAPFALTMFYHGSGWLGFLEETGRGRVLRFRVERGGQTLGYFAAQLIRKGPFRILGSPLSGSMSEYLGPIGNRDFPVEEFLEALDRLCRARGIHQLELGSPALEPAMMRKHNYEVMEWRTLQAGLDPVSEIMWDALSGKARNRIRRARGFGLVTRDSAEPDFVARHYELVLEVFRRQGIRPRFSQADYQTLCGRLKPREEVFTIEVRHPDGPQPVASGIFPHDRETVYSLSTASSDQGRAWCANDLMHWTAMVLAGTRGLSRYRMGDNYRSPASGSRFKDKFAGQSEPVYRFIRHYSSLARHSRRMLVALQRLRQRASRFRGH
jgi:hypothetical protein